ncbi:MAG: preprotein translocase subunit SecG [Bacteriovoracia bacterium]
MITTLIVLHVIICVLLVVTVLLQFGKGAEMGAVMGGGASQAVFSSSSKGNFFTKLTSALAIGFMLNSIALTTLKSREAKKSLFDDEQEIAQPLNNDAAQAAAQPATAPAAPATEATAPQATTTTPAEAPKQ